jgi:hypothetical protein
VKGFFFLSPACVANVIEHRVDFLILIFPFLLFICVLLAFCRYGSVQDFWRFNPWRAPGLSPVYDPCGMAGGSPIPQFNAGEYNTTKCVFSCLFVFLGFVCLFCFLYRITPPLPPPLPPPPPPPPPLPPLPQLLLPLPPPPPPLTAHHYHHYHGPLTTVTAPNPHTHNSGMQSKAISEASFPPCRLARCGSAAASRTHDGSSRPTTVVATSSGL